MKMGRKRLSEQEKKGHISLSLSNWVISHLKTKRNKSQYVEDLIKNDIKKNNL